MLLVGDGDKPNDEKIPGALRALREAAQELATDGKSVRVLELPQTGDDLNAILQRNGAAVVARLLEAAIAGEPVAAGDAPSRRLRVVPFKDASHDFSRGQLVDGWIDHAGLAVVYGASNTGTSFPAIDLGLHVALGRRWFGRRVSQGGVVYVAAESPSSIERRLIALKLHHGLADRDVPFWLIPECVNLVRDGADLDALAATITELSRGQPVRLAIVDTLAQTLAGADENSFEGMGALAARLGEPLQELALSRVR